MSRSLEVIHSAATINVASLAFVVPAGHKYEVVGLSYSSDSSAIVTWYLASITTAGLWFREQFVLPAGSFGVYHGFNGLVHHAAEGIYVIPTSAGAPAVNFSMDYVDVDYLH